MFKNKRRAVVGFIVVIMAGVIGGSARNSLAQAPKLLPGTRSNVLSTIQGNALNPMDGALAQVRIRLRDVRTGRVAGVTTTDKAGMFTFRGLEPGSYVAELMGNGDTTQAASQILHVNAGEMLSAIVKMPYRIPPFALLGHTAPSAATVVAAAAASGVLATTVTGQPVSSRQ
jgi:hypothetical protein